MAKYSAGTAGMTQAQERSGLATSEIGRAKMASVLLSILFHMFTFPFFFFFLGGGKKSVFICISKNIFLSNHFFVSQFLSNYAQNDMKHVVYRFHNAIFEIYFFEMAWYLVCMIGRYLKYCDIFKQVFGMIGRYLKYIDMYRYVFFMKYPTYF